MTKVVPFIFFIYGIQSYFLLNFSGRHLGSTLMCLGVCLAVLITSLVTYDITHQIHIHENGTFDIGFSWLKMKQFEFTEVKDVKIISDQGNFSSIIIELSRERKLHVFFIDDAEKIKEKLLSKKDSSHKLAA